MKKGDSPMHIPIHKVTVISILIAGLAGISALYAQDAQRSPGSTTERAPSVHGGGMMGQRSGMGCMGMMGGGDDSDRPNDQWRKPAPSNPGEKS